MDAMEFPLFGASKAPKVETTVENLVKEETWAKFFPLGEWVHKVPHQLHTLWTSKNEDEVLKAAQYLFNGLFLNHNRISEPEDGQADEDSLILIVELLIEIIRFSWPILKSDAIKKGVLFKQLMILANDFEIPSDEPWGGPPSPVRALGKAAEFIDALLASAKDDLDMLQCCAVVAIRNGMASSTDNDLMVKLMQPIMTVTDDATRACFVYSAANLAKESFFVNDEHKKQFAEMCSNMLSLPDVSLTKLIAALVTARSKTNHASAEELYILADYLLHYEAYEKIFNTTPLGNLVDLSFVIPNFVSKLNPASDIFFTRVLENLKTISAKADANPMQLPIATLLAFSYGMKEPILPGMKVFDLQAMSVSLLKTIVEFGPQFWTNEKILKFLARGGIPKKEDLIAFLADNTDDGSKRFPKFAGLDEIPWDKLGHAYGEATDVPDLLRMLASVNEQKRERARHALYGNIYHQGSTYSATPYAVPYLIEMLECTLVQDKPQILEYCINLLASFPEGYFCKKTGFDVTVEYPLPEDQPEVVEEDHGNEEGHDDDEDDEHEGHGHGGYCGIKHKIEQHLVNGLSVFLDLLKDPNPQSRGVTANVLAFLPRVADQTVPKIKEQLLVDADSSVKGSLMLALGMLLPRVASHEECLKFFNEQWDLVKASDDESVKFCVAACIARLLIGQKPPKFALDQLLTAVGKQDTPIKYHAFDRPSTLAMGLIAILKADDALGHIIQQFKNTTKMFQVLPVLRAMLSIAFRFELENDKPIQPATLKPEQIEVLQAIIDNGDNLVWGFGNASMMLRDDFQLPGNKDQLIEFIEKAKASKDVMEM